MRIIIQCVTLSSSKLWHWGFSGSSVSKDSACNAGELGSIPGSGISPGEGNGYPLQYSCLGNPRTEVHSVARVKYDLATKPSTKWVCWPHLSGPDPFILFSPSFPIALNYTACVTCTIHDFDMSMLSPANLSAPRVWDSCSCTIYCT